jgi:amino acid adenylation domain-containing protein
MAEFGAAVDPTSAERFKLHDLLLKKKDRNASQAQTIPRRVGAGPSPMSFAQQRLWFLDQLEGGSSFYNLPLAVRLPGPFDTASFRRALAEVVRRHEVLRTTFAVIDGEPIQVIAPPTVVPLPIIDLSVLSEKGREAEAARLASSEGCFPFNLASGPLLRAQLLHLGEQQHIALFTLHHIVSDAWSKDVLIKEVGALYEAYATGKESPLAELPIQYADYAAWQRDWLKGKVLEDQLSYWRTQLQGAPPVLNLRTKANRSFVPTHRGGRHPFALTAELTRLLKELSQREGVTLFMTLVGAFQVLLARYSGQDDVVVGTSIAGRGRLETEPLIGFFINTLALRISISGEPTVVELLKRVRDTCLGAYEHQDLPFEKLVEELRPERNLSHAPLFQVLFSLQNVPRKAADSSGLSFMSVKRREVQFELMLSMEESAGQLYGSFAYKTDLFDEFMIKQMANHFQVLLSGMTATPEARLSDLPLLTEAEQRRVLVEWNDTEQPRSRACIHELFAAQVARTPESLALIYGSERLSYAELNARANQLAHHLRGLGVGPEVRVALLLERCVEMVIGLLATLKAGGCYVPLDPQYPLERLRFMLEDSGVEVLLTKEQWLDALPSHRAQELCIDSAWEAIAKESATDLGVTLDAANLAYVIYTSGSTGKPKGVAVTHGGLANYLQWAAGSYPVGEGQGAPVHSPLGFDLTVTSLLLPLLAGGAVTLLSEGVGVEALANALNTSAGFGLVKLTPAHLEALGHSMPVGALARAARMLVVGGEALTGTALAWWARHAPAMRVVNEYGPTETVVGCCVNEVLMGAVGTGAVPIGRPIANTRLFVLGRRGEPLPIGVSGELHIGGVGVARGYLNRPGLTAERFVPDPYSGAAGARLYRTGDMVKHLNDGKLEYLGRQDGQVKVRGFRVELGEIESLLCQHPRVREAVAMSHDSQLVGYVVAEDQSLGEADLRQWLAERLPEHMIPSLFVNRTEFPLTPNGKIDRKALPALDTARREVTEQYLAPATPTEKVLASIWSELLGVEQLGVNDDFFALGGHSLLATQLLSRIRQELNVEIPLMTVFKFPTVRELALEIEASQQLDETSALISETEQGSESDLLTRIDELSQAELDSLLVGMLSNQEPMG